MTKLLLIENGTDEFQEEILSLAATKKINLKFLDEESLEDYLFGEILKKTDTDDLAEDGELERILSNAIQSD